MEKIKVNSLVSRVLCLATIMLCILCTDIVAQNREFRATWLTTVWGIDWPTTQIPVNIECTEGQTVKAFWWNSNLKPMSNIVELR